MKPFSKEEQVREHYRALYAAWGPQHWWPARTRFEVIVGAYLTQNTAWKNVEIALRRLRAAGRLSLVGIRTISLAQLEALIRPAGYFRQKAARLKSFVAFVDRCYGGSLHRMFAQPTRKLRAELLGLNGIGPETADSILLYAGQHPVFVVDAYSQRILERHGILPADAPYEEVRDLFERALAGVAWAPSPAKPGTGTGFKNRFTATSEVSSGAKARVSSSTYGAAEAVPFHKSILKTGRRNLKAIASQGATHSPSPMSLAKRSPLAQVYNDMHGLIVGVGKHYCLKSNPRCEQCPLQKFLP